MAKPEWAERIEALRRKLNLSQAALARAVGVSPMPMNRWLAGKQQPAAENYLRLGNLAEAPECWYFWERAGLDRARLEQALAAPQLRTPPWWYPKLEVLPARERLAPALRQARVVAIPLLRDAAAAGSPRLVEDGQIEDLVLLPRAWCPRPADTSCIRVAGDSMEPKLAHGDLVVVERLQPAERAALFGKMVAAWHRDEGVTVKWLHRYGESEMLVAENRAYPPIPITADPEWRIIGPVLYYIGKAR